MAPKRGGLESGILSLASHFQFPQPIPTDTSILPANLPDPFCQRRNFQLEVEKKPRNFSKLNKLGPLWPEGVATILLLQKFKDKDEIGMMMVG